MLANIGRWLRCQMNVFHNPKLHQSVFVASPQTRVAALPLRSRAAKPPALGLLLGLSWWGWVGQVRRILAATHPPPPPVYGGCNRGSLGHPVLCNRSCRFFADGLCENGDDCNFCHMEHGKRALLSARRWNPGGPPGPAGPSPTKKRRREGACASNFAARARAWRRSPACAFAKP